MLQVNSYALYGGAPTGSLKDAIKFATKTLGDDCIIFIDLQHALQIENDLKQYPNAQFISLKSSEHSLRDEEILLLLNSKENIWQGSERTSHLQIRNNILSLRNQFINVDASYAKDYGIYGIRAIKKEDYDTIA